MIGGIVRAGATAAAPDDPCGQVLHRQDGRGRDLRGRNFCFLSFYVILCPFLYTVGSLLFQQQKSVSE